MYHKYVKKKFQFPFFNKVGTILFWRIISVFHWRMWKPYDAIGVSDRPIFKAQKTNIMISNYILNLKINAYIQYQNFKKIEITYYLHKLRQFIFFKWLFDLNFQRHYHFSEQLFAHVKIGKEITFPYLEEWNWIWLSSGLWWLLLLCNSNPQKKENNVCDCVINRWYIIEWNKMHAKCEAENGENTSFSKSQSKIIFTFELKISMKWDLSILTFLKTFTV